MPWVGEFSFFVGYMMQILIRNSAKCLDCNKEIESKSTHDFKSCGCPNGLCVDGGLAYIRRSAMNLSRVEETSIYEEVSYIGKLLKHQNKFYIVVRENPTNDATIADLGISLLEDHDTVFSVPLSLPRYNRMGYSFV